MKDRYISLTTYRRDGRAIATPVWFAQDGNRILVWTEAATGKAKRVRATRRASIAACDMRGRMTEPPVEVQARVLSSDEFAVADHLFSAKYRYLKRVVLLGKRARAIVARQPVAPDVYIELCADLS